ncbi:hypothetical protein Taro_045708 [Colocasia esculenta]|uniref:Uncharacterized protein n=1 Tax=Colocasia esculenta TaxID=4460 RepID=A0A843WRZ3_COLES|nr:hypothetical protein [Colocasia esculenta]
MSGRSHHTTSMEHSSTSTPEKTGTTMGQTTTNESLYTSHDHWQSTSRKERCHHTGTDYWFMTPVSNPNNRTQELPLSLAVTDERSNCRSTST